MPIQSRCPSCAAALPSGAAWCSLCHADLRAKPAPAPTATVESVLPSGSAPAEAPAARISGRHAKEPVGRREAPRREPRRTTQTLDPSLVLEGIDLPDADATPDEVDEVADRMLARLAMAEPKSRVLDPSDLPGGKWMFAAATGTAVVVVMLLLFTVLGAILGD